MMSLRTPTSSRAKATQVLGRSTLTLSNGKRGSQSFHVTSTSNPNLRHFLSGLQELHRVCRKAELVQVNSVEVTGWSHEQLVCVLKQHLATLRDDELRLTLQAKDSEGRKHIVEVIIDVIYEDGFSLGDKARAAYNIIVRMKDKIVTTPDVTDMTFENSYYIRVRHGAQTGFFLKEDSNHTLCMDIPTSENNDYVFKCYSFTGHNAERGGGGEGEFPELCVLQLPSSGRFVAACPTSGCLTTDQDEDFRTSITSITSPDHHFFIIHRTGDGESEAFCLRPLVMRNYYLHYDAVRGLKLKKCVPPPYRNFSVLRFFSFRFVQASYTGQ